ncbi:MAG: universal stress protein [Burkholderiaceae bacterium]|jgi:nucleotide-binding universal stress UspA family protein|nr:universal stress protein [Aquabacterium sp.]NUP84283.1 universal stress protein [Burkholderiaceae bacterium]
MIAPFGPILVATDFSGHARHAAARAARLAHDTHSALTLMHVLPAQPVTKVRKWLGASSARERKVCDEARRQLCQLASELTSVRRVEFDIEAAAGSAPDEIVRAADRVDARLLVLGARGAGFLRRLVLGTTSQRLVRRTDRPLLVVRQTAARSYRRVLVAVDFSPRSRHALNLAQRVAPNAKLVILTVFEVPFEGKIRFAGVDDATFEIYRKRARAEALRQLHALAHEAGLSPSQWEPSVVEGDASRRIVEQEQSRNCDLVVLTPHGQSAAADLLLGSVTRHVLVEGHVDVLLSTRMPGQPIRPWE